MPEPVTLQFIEHDVVEYSYDFFSIDFFSFDEQYDDFLFDDYYAMDNYLEFAQVLDEPLPVSDNFENSHQFTDNYKMISQSFYHIALNFKKIVLLKSTFLFNPTLKNRNEVFKEFRVHRHYVGGKIINNIIKNKFYYNNHKNNIQLYNYMIKTFISKVNQPHIHKKTHHFFLLMIV